MGVCLGRSHQRETCSDVISVKAKFYENDVTNRKSCCYHGISCTNTLSSSACRFDPNPLIKSTYVFMIIFKIHL